MADPVRIRFTLAAVDELQLHEEIVKFPVPGFVGLCRDGFTVDLIFTDPLTFTQLASLTAIVSAHVPNPGNKAGRAAKEAAARLNDPQSPDDHLYRSVIRTLVPVLNQSRQLQGLPPIDEAGLLAGVLGQLPPVPVVVTPSIVPVGP